MFKGHLACADFLLNQSGVDVNIRDESGRSLLSQTIDNMTDDKAVSQLKYLLDKDGIDVNLADTQGLTPLHLIATKVGNDEEVLKNPSRCVTIIHSMSIIISLAYIRIVGDTVTGTL